MATVTITFRDLDDGDVVTVVDFHGGFNAESGAHELAADIMTELHDEDKPND